MRDIGKMVRMPSERIRNGIFAVSLGVFLFSVPWSTAISNIGLVALSIGFLVSVDKKMIRSVVKNRIWLLLILNFIWFLAGLFLSYQELIPDYSERIGKYVLVVLLPLMIIPAINLNKKQLFLAIGSFVLSIFIILSSSFYEAIFSQASGLSKAINYSTFLQRSSDYHPAYVSMFTVCSIFLCLEVILGAKQKVTRYVLGTLILFFLISLLVIQARTPLIALLLLLPVYFLVSNNAASRQMKIRLILTGGFVFIALILIWFCVDKQSALLAKERIVDGFYNSLNIRLDTWSCSWEKYRTGSFLFGVGSGNEQLMLNECYYERFLTRHFYSAYNAHSDMLLILLRNGLIGLGLWLLFLISFFKESIKNKFFLGFMIVLLFVISGLTEAYLNRIWGSLFFGATVGLSIVQWNRKSTNLISDKI